MGPMAVALRGRFIHGTVTPGILELISDGLIVVDDSGIITWFLTDSAAVDFFIAANPALAINKMRRQEFCVPGMIDTHVHAVARPLFNCR